MAEHNGKDQGTWVERIRNERFLFLLLVVLQLSYFAWIVLNRRIPGGHDGLQYLTLQYYFLNGAVVDGEIPNWMPFMLHGTATSWWYLVQASLFQNVALMTSALWKGINFFYIFQLNMLVDEWVLLVGTWLLARRFFASSLSVFFVTVSVWCSALWWTQPWFNFHFYYAIPLILHLLHRFMETARWRYLVLGSNLIAMQTVGNLPYYIPVTTLVVFLYFCAYAIVNWSCVSRRLRNLRFEGAFFVSIGVIALSFAAAFIFLKIGSDQILMLSQGKNVDGSTPLSVFLSYGDNLNLHKWKEMIYGISASIDYTLFSGLLQVLCLFLGVFWCLQRRSAHVLIVIALLLAMSVCSVVAAFFYQVWPFMKFYRHLALLAPLIKIFVCFLGGFGFDRLVSDHGKEHGRIYLFGGVIMLGLAFWLSSFNGPGIVEDVLRMVKFNGETALLQNDSVGGVFMERISKSTMLAAFFGFALLIMAFIKTRRLRLGVILLVLAVHVWDVFSYKWEESSSRSMSLDQRKFAILQFQKMPYRDRRVERFNPDQVDRAAFLKGLPVQGLLNWSMNSFLFVDEVHSSWRTDYWHVGLDQLMRAYWGQSINDHSIKVKGQHYFATLDFPSGHPAIGKLVGNREDKIQFFSNAHVFRNEETVAEQLTDQRFSGDQLYLLGSGADNDSFAPGANERLRLPYKILRFTSNRLELAVDNDLGRNIWLMYSDNWHPFWSVTVNGKPQRVWRADLAYKAIALNPGPNVVQFDFGSKVLGILQRFFGFNAGLWVLAIAWLTRRIFTAGPTEHEASSNVPKRA